VHRALHPLAILILGLSLAGCTSGSARTNSAASFHWTSPTKRVVLVEPDVQLGQLDVGGIFEPRADWTETAQGFINTNLRAHFAGSGAEVVDATLATPREVQLAKLHGAVGQAILTHLYSEQLALPNKGNALDWTLGPGTIEMRDRYGADYALFVFVRDSYSTAGRKALQVIGFLGNAVGLGVIVPGGVQVGFASLVDLRTGNIVWFNRLLNTSGDLRTEAPARRTVDELIRDIPI
jgi:hypothetical protein